MIIKKIGKYVVKGLLGRGGMGAVYKVVMPVTDKIVALKVCQPRETLADVLGMEEIRRRFLKEAVILARLRHPNIAGVWDLGEDGDRPFFTMEYYCNNLGNLIGETYRVEETSRMLSVDAALHYARQALSALGCLHHAGIIHMDVKPYNMMITDDDRVKFIDFGLSKLRGETWTGPDNIKVGTPYYTAPEQEAKPEKADERADLFSVGVLIFRMLTGRVPLDEEKASAVNPMLDQEWDRFLARSLHEKREKRYQNARDMMEALERLARHWEERKDKTCALIAEDPSRVLKDREAASRPRSQPIRVGIREARARFGMDDLWRPAVYIRNRFMEKRGGVVQDEATGLQWEKGGTPYLVTWHEARQYVDRLNKKRFAGFSDWRLPTVPELMSIFRRVDQPGDFCLPSLFDPDKRRLWSIDRKSFVAAWYADAEMGFVWWQDFTCYFHARAVRTARGPD